MRHGPAEDVASTGRDADRALSTPGRDRVRDVAHALAHADEAPHCILSSPLVRALQTAEIVAAVTKIERHGGTVETTREIAPGGDAVPLARQLVRDKRRRTMLVGHQPDLSDLVYRLTGHHLEMLKAMVVGLHATDDGMRLRFVLEPKELTWERFE